MTEELKIRIRDLDRLEERLDELDAEFDKEIDVKDTYFQTSGENVLKVIQDDTGDYLVEYVPTNDGFEVKRREELDDPELTIRKLRKESGIESVLNKKKFFWKIDELTLELTLIEDLGDFIIVKGDTVEKSFVKNVLKMDDPEYIDVSFSQLEK